MDSSRSIEVARNEVEMLLPAHLMPLPKSSLLPHVKLTFSLDQTNNSVLLKENAEKDFSQTVVEEPVMNVT
jgi:hypothetical protein